MGLLCMHKSLKALVIFIFTHQFIKYFAGYFGINDSFRAKYTLNLSFKTPVWSKF